MKKLLNRLGPLLTLIVTLALVQAQPTAPDNTSFVRVAHLSPNAEAVNITLNSTDGNTQLSPEALTDLSYRSTTEYLELPADEYDIAIETRAGTLQQTVTLTPGLYYTAALVGLVIPEELNAEGENGFFDFFTDLFTSEDDRAALALRLIDYEDSLFSTPVGGPRGMTPRNQVAPGQQRPAASTRPPSAGTPLENLVYLRLVHAAPGTEPVTLEFADPEASDAEARTFVTDLAFAEVSGLNTVTQAEAQNLEVSLAGTEAGALTLGLDDATFETGQLHTLFVVGTPTETAPLEVLTVSSPLPMVTTPGTASGGTMTGGNMSGGAGTQGGNSQASAQLQDLQGNTIGNATMRTTPSGVAVEVNLTEFSAAAGGVRALHLHQVGRCEPPFESAGDHYNPAESEHGFLSPNGPHAGDLPNISVDGSGNARYSFTTNLVTLEPGDRTLADDDGSALVIHNTADDYLTNPSGGGGDRIACGVIEPAGTQ